MTQIHLENCFLCPSIDLFDAVQPYECGGYERARCRDTLVENGLPGFAHSVLPELAECCQKLSKGCFFMKLAEAWTVLLM